MHEQTKKWLSIGMVALSGFVLVSVFGTPGGGHPLIPSLVPLFGIGFVSYLQFFQFGYCYSFDIKKGFLWILGAWAVIIPFICLGWHLGIVLLLYADLLG